MMVLRVLLCIGHDTPLKKIMSSIPGSPGMDGGVGGGVPERQVEQYDVGLCLDLQ